MSIVNKKAFSDFDIKEKMEAGIALFGSEVKAIKEGHADLTGSFVRILNNQAFLISAKVFPYEYARLEGYDSLRTRKLLLHKNQIIALKSKIDGQRLNLVPIALYVKNNFIKLEIALGKSRKKYEKKEALKKKDLEREIQRKIS